MITSTNAYDAPSIYQLIEYFQYIIENYNKEYKRTMIMDFELFEKAIQIIVSIENSLTLPKVFWLYYCNGHIMPISNMKWFIKNVINPNMTKYIFSWSWKIRHMFDKLILYINLRR